MKKKKLNRRSIMVILIMFITVTFATFNTNLFIDGRAYVRAEDLVRITNIELIEATEQAFETYNPEYTADTITLNANLPKQNSTAQYRITITNNSDYDYDVQNIAEQKYSNTNISYEIVGLVKDSTVLEAHTTSTFLLNLSNNTTISEEEDVYQTKSYGFEYTGGEQEFVVPFDGEYNIELWGAQGGSYDEEFIGGYGGYSKGTITLKKGTKLYINVGGQGTSNNKKLVVAPGGYNGGGPGDYCSDYWITSGGGGATHIAFIKGTLKSLEPYKGTLIGDTHYESDQIIMVASGGGGASYATHDADYYGSGSGGSGGGIKGVKGFNSGDKIKYNGGDGGEQTKSPETSNCGLGGFGGYLTSKKGCGHGGSGSGFYAGNSGHGPAGGGGSGYIANPSLVNKEMYCFNCEESSATPTKTISTENHSSNPKSQYAKEGNGYAKITFNRKIEDGSDYDFKYTGGQQTLTVPYTGIYKLETWGAQGGTQDNAKTRDGFGGYSTGKIKLSKNDILYINVGGQGKDYCDSKDGKRVFFTGGYNGGGDGATWIDNKCGGSGGGATHIATTSGQLFELEESKDSILIVSGGGGGFDGQTGSYLGTGGSGGGYTGNNGTSQSGNYIGTGGTQTQGGINFNQAVTNRFSHDGLFGLGGSALQPDQIENGGNISGGGGGYYGGGGGCGNGGFAGGGSGYIGNDSLFDKVMYCFNCQESQDFETKTVTTTSHAKEPKQNIPKEGNGYSRITLVQRQSNSIELSLKFYIKRLPDYDITYNLNGGSISGQKVTYTRNTDTFTLPTPTKDGYTFAGWTGGKNLFDKDNVEVINAYISPELPEVTENNYNRLFIMPIEANTTYVVSKLKGAQLQLAYTESHPSVGTEVLGQTGFHATIYNYNDTTRHYITITTGETAKYLVCRFNQTSQDTYTTQQLMDSIQVEIGTKPTAYESYVNTSSVTIQKGSRGNRVYTASWQAITYNISYVLDGGSLSNSVTTYTADSETFNLPTPTRTGYTFKGWTVGKNLFDKDTITFTKSKQFNMDTGELEDRADSNWRISDYIPVYGVKTLVFSGDYIPVTWSMRYCLYDEDKNFIKSYYYQNSASRNKTFYAESNVDIYYVRFQAYFNSNYDTAYNPSSILIEPGTEKTSYTSYLGTPTKSLQITKGSTGNRVYKANWEANDYEIEYDLGGGTISNPPTTYNSETETFTLPTPTKAGYEFVGWTGGKNLYDWNRLNNAYDFQVTSSIDGNKHLHINSNMSISTATFTSITPTFTFLSGKKYRVSFDTSGDFDHTAISTAIWGDTSQNFYTFGKNFTFSPNQDLTMYFLLYVKSNQGSMEIYNFQIEEGDKATPYESYISTPQSVTIPKGSAGNRVYHAVWRDSSAPTLSLNKETTIDVGTSEWALSNASINGDEIILGANESEGSAICNYIDIGNGNWNISFDVYTDNLSPYQEWHDANRGALHIQSSYYDENKETKVSPNGYSSNGHARDIELGVWNHFGPWAYNNAYGSGVRYIRFTLRTSGTYSLPPIKFKNIKVSGSEIPNSFYDIKITSSDNVGVTTTKYAAGSHDVNYFKTNGTVVNGDSVRVTSNGIYTVYVEDAAGNGKVAEIEITNIQ